MAQGNESDWQFLSRLAGEIGFEVAVVEGKLDFRTPTPSDEAPEAGDHTTADPLALVPGSEPAAVPVDRDVGRAGEGGRRPGLGRRPSKQVVVGRAAAATTSAELGVDPGRPGREVRRRPSTAWRRPFAGQAEVDALAKALADQIAGAFAEFEGVARGDPKLRAGKAVSLGLAGDPFDGRYTLTTTRHVFDPDEGYTTLFTASGRQERSLLGLASGGNGGQGRRRRPGRGQRHRHRRARPREPVPGQGASSRPCPTATRATGPARCRPGPAAERGAVNLPEVNDEVLVAFERGDLRRPYIVGGLYNGVDTPEHGRGARRPGQRRA